MSMSKSLTGLSGMDAKPVVDFRPDHYDYIKVGQRAQIYALNHPRLGEMYVDTSIVLRINEDGSFETQNTNYRPLQQLNG